VKYKYKSKDNQRQREHYNTCMHHGPVSSQIYREFITDYLNEERQIIMICLTIRMCEVRYIEN